MRKPESEDEVAYLEREELLGDYIGQRPSLLLAFLSIAERYADIEKREKNERH